MKRKGAKITKTKLKKKEKVGGITIILRFIHSGVIKNVWYRWMNRHTDLWKKINKP